MRDPQCDLCAFGIRSPRTPKNICLMDLPMYEASVTEDAEHPEIDVMIVAEMPTLTDDTYNKTFVGKGLKEIKDYFVKAGLRVYTTYAIKCPKPDRNLKLLERHIKPCADNYLAKEIATLKPKHIITLGTNAMYAVTRKKGMLDKRGNRTFDPRCNAYIYPTLHQAQAAYNAEQREMMQADLKLFAEWIITEVNGGNASEGFDPPVIVVDTLAGLRKMRQMIRDAGGIVAVDTETTGLNAYVAEGHIRTIQFCWDPEIGGVFVPLIVGEGCYYHTPDNLAAPFWEDEPLEDAIEIIRDILAESRCIWHNGKFDRIWLHNWGKRNFGKPILAPNTYMDTLHVAHMINENRPLKLKKLITEELGVPTYDIADKLTKDLGLLIPYATKDTVASLLLARKYYAYLKEHHKMRKLYFNVTRRADLLFTRMELRGWPVDEEVALEVKEGLDEKIFAAQGELHEILAQKGIVIDPKALASPQKLAVILFDQLELPMHEDKAVAYTETGGRATNEIAIFHLKDHPFVFKLLEWKGYTKAMSTYVEPMLRAARQRGRLTTSYKLAGTVTGRTASGKEGRGKTANGMNLQNLPHEFGIRNIVKAAPGYSIIECDFSQIELRVAGELAQDRLLLDAYRRGDDIHAIRGMRVSGMSPEEWEKADPKLTKGLRQKAKPINFGFLYGMSANKFQNYALTQYGVNFTMAECVAIRKGFFTDHAGLEPWYKKQENMAGRLGYVESLSGRRRHLPNLSLDPDSGRDARQKYQDALRQAINTPVQGFASDMKLMALVEIDATINPEYAQVIGEIHDSILIECRTEHVMEVAGQAIDIMRHPRLLDVLDIHIGVPIDAEAKAGQSLGEAKELAGL